MGYSPLLAVDPTVFQPDRKIQKFARQMNGLRRAIDV